MKHTYLLRLLALWGLLTLASAARAQNVGIGTTTPTQALDVNGQLRVRGLSGQGGLPQVLPDGTLGLYSPAPPAATDPLATNPALLNAGSSTTIGIITPTGTKPQSVAVSGSIAYVVNTGSNSLQLFDISNPASPRLLNGSSPAGGTATDANPQSVAVSGSIAYVVNAKGNSLQLFDVSNPASPRLLNTSGTATDNSPQCVAVSGSIVYVVNGDGNSLQLFDVSNPASPRLLSTVQTETNPQSVAVSGTAAYVVNAGSNSLQLFDVSNPASPTLPKGARITTGTNPQGVAVSGGIAYVVSAGSNLLQLFDVSNPASPSLLNKNSGALGTGTITNAGPQSVAVSGGIACVVNATSNSLQLFRVATGQALGVFSDGTLTTVASLAAAGGDNLGNHTATQQLVLASQGLKFSDGTTQTTAATAAAFIQNSATPQAGASFNVAGSGTVGGGLVADANGANTGTVASALVFGRSSSGEGLGSNRSSGTNSFGLDLYTSSQNRLAITSTGNVGIGTAAPGQLLEVGGQASPALLLHSTGNSAVNGATLQWRESNLTYGWNLRHNTGGSEGGSTNDRLLLDRLNGGTPTTTMSWDQNTGNVGIGTSAPASALDVRGAATVSTSVTTPALLTPTTGPHNMAAVAYGTCLPDGTLSFSSGNVVVNKGSAGAYSLSITGKDNTVPYVLTATPTGTGPVGTFVETTLLSIVAGSYLPIITTYRVVNGTQVTADHGFSFVIYQP